MGYVNRRHFAVDRLSDQGRELVARGVADKWTLEQIQRELREVCGERIAKSSIHRWMQWERTRQRIAQRQQAADAALEMVSADPDGRVAHALSLALQEYLLNKEEELGEQSADELMENLRQMQKLGIAHKRVQLEERAVAADEERAAAATTQAEAALLTAQARIKALEQKASEAAKTLESAEKKIASGRALSPEELRNIREQVFGMVEVVDAA